MKSSDRKDQRRQTIVSIARDAFFETGYGGTTMSAIAARLGGSKTTLWRYFRSKQDLFSAVVDDLVARYGEALTSPLPTESDPKEVINDLAQKLMRVLLQPEIIALHRMVTGEAGRFPELGRLLYDRGPRRGQERIAAWVSVQMEKGLLRRADPFQAAQHFAALCQAGSFQRYLIGAIDRPSQKDVETEGDAAAQIFLRAYLV